METDVLGCNFVNICRTEIYSLLLERELNNLCNEYNESRILCRYQVLKWQKLNFGKSVTQVIFLKSGHLKMWAFSDKR